jgi:hypothetical protein
VLARVDRVHVAGGDLLLDELAEVLRVLVLVRLGMPLRGHVLHEPLGDLDLLRLHLGLLEIGVDVLEVVGGADLAREAQQLEDERVSAHADSRDVLARADDHLRDADLARALQDLPQQDVALAARLQRLEVVRLLVVDRVDLARVDEVDDLDRATPLRARAREVLGA